MTATPSYKYINGRQNLAQGRALGVFYNNDALFGYPTGCQIQGDDATDWFLAVPLPKGISQTSTWACNRPSTP